MNINTEKVKKISLEILKEIAKFYEEMVELITFDDLKRNMYYMEGDPRRISVNIRSLEQKGFIKINRSSNSVEITNKGKIKLLEDSNNKSIDGKWRVLSFDIPENCRNKRNQLRRSIKRIGYKQVQKSLWVCPFVRADEVNLIIKELQIEKYTAYLRVDKTDIEIHLKKLFKKELSK